MPRYKFSAQTAVGGGTVLTSCEPKWWLDVYRRSETWLNAYGFKLKLSDAFQNASLVRRQVFNKVRMTI